MWIRSTSGSPRTVARCTDLLLAQSEEFRRLWNDHEIGIRPNAVKRFIHPELGALELNCQTLLDPEQAHLLLVYTAVPGSESHDKLQLLSVIGSRFADARHAGEAGRSPFAVCGASRTV
jgi:hypothetical protein